MKRITITVIAIASLGLPTLTASTALAATATTKPATASAKKQPLGDISKFRTITADTLAYAQKGDLKKAEKRITDMETKWDAYEIPLKKKDSAQWTKLDLALDRVLKQLRASKPNAATSVPAIQDMLKLIDSMS
jgi:hypothetical protein